MIFLLFIQLNIFAQIQKASRITKATGGHAIERTNANAMARKPVMIGTARLPAKKPKYSGN